MSMELHIFVEGTRVPSRDLWQQGIEQLGMPAILDLSLDVHRDTGFTPTKFRGRLTGFEFQIEPTEMVVRDYPHVVERIGLRDMCATFRWGGDLDECAAALSAAAALIRMTNGTYFFPDDDVYYNAEEAIAAIQSELKSIEKINAKR